MPSLLRKCSTPASDDDGWLYIDSTGYVNYGTPHQAAALETGTGEFTSGTWTHIAVATNNDGEVPGSDDARYIYINGELIVNDTDVDDVVHLDPWASKVNGFKANGVVTEVHSFMLFHSYLTEAQIREHACCGVNGEANPTSRDAILSGAVDCSTY